MPIAPYDILMLIVLVATTLWGVWKGMAWQVAALASVVVSAAVAIHSSAAAAPYFPGQDPWNRYLAMLVLYLVTAAAIWIVFHLVSNIIDRVQLKEFDRQIGAIIGLAKGVLYCFGHHLLCRHALGVHPAIGAAIAQRRLDRPRHSQREPRVAGRHPHVSGQVHRRVRRAVARPAEGGAGAAGTAEDRPWAP